MNTPGQLANARLPASRLNGPTLRTRASVAVIIPCFNIRPYLRQAVQSVLAQTFADFELIVVDDASSDGSLDTIRDLRDPRLRLESIAHRGSAGARNEGVLRSTAALISFLDGDDVWEPNRLAEHVRAMDQNPDVDLSFSLTRVIGPDGRSLFPMRGHRGGRLNLADLYVENHIRNGSSVMLRRSALDSVGPFDESLAASCDVDMWLRLASPRRSNVLCVPKVLNLYRRRAVQITSNRKRVSGALDGVYLKAAASNARLLDPLLPRNLVNRRRYYAYLALEGGEHRAALAQLMQSWVASPWHFVFEPRSWLLLAYIALSSIPFLRGTLVTPTGPATTRS